jgi:PAS domain S-box-containing protein
MARFPLYVAGTNQQYPVEHLPLIQALQGESVRVDDIEIIRADERVCLEVWSSPIFDEQGRINYAIAVFRDITERKQIASELNKYRLHLEEMVAQRTEELAAVNETLQQDILKRQQVEEELRKLSRAVEQSASTIVITDLSGAIEFVNPAFTRITGYTAEEALGQNPRILKSGEMSPETYAELWTTITRGDVWEGELLNKKKNGELYWEFVTISPVKNREDQIAHYVAVKDDITERKQAEEQLKESHQKLQAANKRLAVIHKMGQMITTHLELEMVLDILARNTAKLLGSDTSAILLVDEVTQTLSIKGAYGLSEYVVKNTRDRLGESIAGRVALAGKPLVINDLPNDPTFYNPAARDEGLLACASVPLIVGEKIIGTLDVHSKTERYAFGDEQVHFLQMLAGQAAIAIENARLFEEERKAKEATEAANTALAALNTIAFTVNSSLDLEADLEKALEIVLREMKLDHGWVFLSEDNGRFLRLAASVGLPDNFRHQEALTPVGRCACEEVLSVGEVRRHFERNACSRLMPYQQQDSTLSSQHISLPISVKQEVVGLLNLGGVNITKLAPENYAWLETVAQQIGNAIENATLYQNVLGKTERLSALNRVSTIVSLSWELDEVLPPLLREMARVLETSLGVVVLRSEEIRPEENKDRYRVRARFGQWQSPAKLAAVAWHKLPLLKTIEQTQAPLMIPKAAGDERLQSLSGLIDQERIQTVLILPLVVQNQVTGFIMLGTLGRERIFESAEVELARTLTNQAAVAIEKARLYEETVTRYEQELEIARQIQQNLLPHSVPEIPGLRIAGLCQPAYATGGDFYDYILLPDQRLGIVVSDVTGKSLPAAMVMALARNTIRSELLKTPSPDEALTAANQWLYQDTQRDTFVATVQALIDPAKQNMWLVNAGQTAGLLLRNGQTSYLLPDEAVGLPLGIQQNITYTHAQIPLQSGDILLFYTDGIVEAQNTAGEMFSFDRLEATLQKFQNGYEPTQIIDTLMAEMQAFVGKAEQHDDITLVVVQVE